MCRNEPNGDQPYRTNDHDQYASTISHAASLALTEGEPALRLHNFGPQLTSGLL